MKFKSFLFLLFFIITLVVKSQTPTWAETIANVLNNNCNSCHISGGIAPFSLVGYDNAKAFASNIKSATQAKRMPPWPADPNYKRYSHERILSADEIKWIADWVDGGTPKGDASKAPADPTLKKGAQMTNPNKVIKIPNYRVNTTGDLYRCYVFDVNLPAGTFITEVEVLPASDKFVHHAILYQDNTSTPVTLDAADTAAGYTNFGGTGSSASSMVATWVPGQSPTKFPVGMGVQLSAGARLILQVHYPGGVSLGVDSTKVLIKTSTASLRSIYSNFVINHGTSMIDGPLVIPANTKTTFNAVYPKTGGTSLKLTIFSVGPHMHLIGKSMKVFATSGADTTKLINVNNWNFHWQYKYDFQKPIILNAGSKIWAQAYYDNTAANPLNPSSPPKLVTAGEATTDEMLICAFYFTNYVAGDENIILDSGTLKNLTLKNSTLSRDMQVTVYPNPANKICYARLPENVVLNNLEILNVQGKSVVCNWVKKGTELSIYLPKLPGIYIIRFLTPDGILTKKVVVEN